MHSRTVLAVVALVVVGLLAGVTVVGAQGQYVSGEPELSVFAPDPALIPGETNSLELQVANDGTQRWGPAAQRDQVTTARSVQLEVRDGGTPFAVETERQSIGSLPDGDVRSIPVAVRVPADVEPGTYSLDVRLRYSHVAQSDPGSGVVQERTRRVTRTIDVKVEERPRFQLHGIESDAQIGGAGSVAVEVENTGEEPARDIAVGLESTSPNVGFGEAQRDTARIERLDPGEATIVEYDVAVRDGTAVRNYTLDGTVEFTDPDGIRGIEDGLSVGFSPLDAQGLDIGIQRSTLRVGEVGTIAGTVQNDGPLPVEDVSIAPADGSLLEAQSGPYAVGDLDVDESATFRLRVAVPETADAVPQRIDLATSYRTDGERDRMTTDPVSVQIDEQEFDVALEESTLRVGETGEIVGTINNDGPVAVDGVTVTLGDGEFEPRSRTYAVGSLEPGETADFRFRATVPAGTDATPQRIDVTTTYRTAAGHDRAVTDPIRVPVAERRDAVAVTAVDPTFVAGGDGTLALEVTNQRDVEIRDVRLRLSVEDPLESDFTTTIVPSLAPGETDRVAFDLEVDSDAPPSQYPAVLDVEYLDPDDETQTVRPLTLSVSVTEDPDEPFLAIEILAFIAVMILVVAAFVWLYRR
ncbi:S-layer protein [Halalkaliarchaeum desulfuricum]|uniref:S-layer protein n=1 Tax=Halalkaliarchaeum desulfuricum TaxID=2055893 RepID=A0A343TK00_9EURY|nr:NEW3 domain-containing protein [Halalkaliarchaeum desulfuricum]AUX09422.1 S-layer protein [Halalkaliarchaeum desulfuricum]